MTKRKTSAETARNQTLKAAAEQKADAAATVGVDLDQAKVAAAREQGALDAEKEAGKQSYKYATDGNLPGEEPRRQLTGYDRNANFLEPILGQGIDQFTATIAEDAPVPLPEEDVAGLLALERNGQNRTDYVKACIKRLGLTKDDPLPGGGPGYTNDIHPVSDLYSD